MSANLVTCQVDDITDETGKRKAKVLIQAANSWEPNVLGFLQVPHLLQSKSYKGPRSVITFSLDAVGGPHARNGLPLP